MGKPIQLLINIVDNIYRLYGGEMPPAEEEKVQKVLAILSD